MGILSWWKGNKSQPEAAKSSTQNSNGTAPATVTATAKPVEVAGMNGAMEVPRPPNASVSVFEFGSVGVSNDKVTLAGYCPVSEELEPCRWEILPAVDSNAPQFRVVF